MRMLLAGLGASVLGLGLYAWPMAGALRTAAGPGGGSQQVAWTTEPTRVTGDQGLRRVAPDLRTSLNTPPPPPLPPIPRTAWRAPEPVERLPPPWAMADLEDLEEVRPAPRRPRRAMRHEMRVGRWYARREVRSYARSSAFERSPNYDLMLGR